MGTARHIEEGGRRVQRRAGLERQNGVRPVRRRAGLEGKVSPHTLRHTAMSWALQSGTTIWDASDYFGVTPEVINRVYGHHCPERHKGVGEALTRRQRA